MQARYLGHRDGSSQSDKLTIGRCYTACRSRSDINHYLLVNDTGSISTVHVTRLCFEGAILPDWYVEMHHPDAAESGDPFDEIVPTATQQKVIADAYTDGTAAISVSADGIRGHTVDTIIKDDIEPEDPVYPRYKPEIF